MKKQIETLTEFLDYALSDWSMDYDYTIVDSDESYYVFDVEITYMGNCANANFKVLRDSTTMMVEMGGNNWKVVDHHSPDVRWFWMKVSPYLFPV
jgi:nitrous oxide reductase accessory protein NosL